MHSHTIGLQNCKSFHVKFYLSFPRTDLDIPLCSDQAGGVNPAERLSPKHLVLLKNAFTGTGTETQPNSQPEEVQGGDKVMEKGEFHEVLRSLIGADIKDEWNERFFNEVSQSRNNMRQ